MTPSQERNEDVLKYQFLAQQAQTIEQQTQLVHQQIEELEDLQRNLEEFKHTQKGSNSFVALGPGVFVEATIQDTQNIHISVGAGTLIKKTVQEAKEITAKQIKDLQSIDKELHEQQEKIMKEVEKMQQGLNSGQDKPKRLHKK